MSLVRLEGSDIFTVSTGVTVHNAQGNGSQMAPSRPEIFGDTSVNADSTNSSIIWE